MKNSAKEFLDAISEKKELREYLETYQVPEGMEKEDCLAAIAEKFGFAVTKEELTEAFRCRKEELRAAAAGAEEAVRDIPIAELDSVAGGGDVEVVGVEKGHDECEYTFFNKENCWFNDACDITFTDYWHYICNFADSRY